MGLEERVKILKQEVELMSKVYAKGFGNMAFATSVNSDAYLHEEDKRDEYKKMVLEQLQYLENHYQNVIPFEEIQGNKDHSPVFKVKELLEEYGSKVRDFLEKPDEEKLENIFSMCGDIMLLGETLREKFNAKLHALQEYPGFENYKVVLVDHNKRFWKRKSF